MIVRHRRAVLLVGLIVAALVVIVILASPSHEPGSPSGGSPTASASGGLVTPSPTPSAMASASAAGLTPIQSPAIGSTPTPAAVSCTPTDQDAYVYNPGRLEVAQPCIRVTGVIAAVRTEADGDLHILLALDPPYAYLLTPANQGVELGDLVVEPICVHPVTQADAIASCQADPDPMSVLPKLGDYVWMEGRYVFDLEHGGWAELHPLYRWGYQSGAPIPIGSPTPAQASAGGCDPAYPTVCIPPPPPDLNCADIPYRNFKVLPPDPHHFDGDHDGIGCET